MLAIAQWNAEVEEQEIELIERGVAPRDAHLMAERLISNRRREKIADKSGS